MAKKTKTPIELEELQETIRTRFTGQTDRGSVLIAAAYLDDALEDCLRARFVQDEKAIDDLLGGEKPLGTFSARISTAYLLGLIDQKMRADLDAIRKIRNDFAHKRHHLRFSDQSIKDKCNNLRGARVFEIGSGFPITNPRDRYLVTVSLLTYDLIELANETQPVTQIPYSYEASIRRRAKSYSLDQMLAVLNQQAG